MSIIVSIVVPTYNRHNQITQTVSALREQNLSKDSYEIIVVDDGSTPPVEISFDDIFPAFQVLRVEGIERSAARNAGAKIAKGEVIIFIDDDMMVSQDFVSSHLQAHSEWSNGLAVGRITLKEDDMKTPFGRFRHQLEITYVPTTRGLVESKNFCAAGNMSIKRERFFILGGFDENLNSGEDQDFALRHTAQDGQIVFLPEAVGVHYDTALDIRSYCRRSEWGNEFVEKFCRKHPEFTDNIERNRINGFVRFGNEPLGLSINKIIKSLLAAKPVVALLFLITSFLEKLAPNSYLLVRFYQLLLGIHIFRGFRRALRQNQNAN